MNERKYELAPEYFEYRETRSRNNDYRYDFTVFTPTYNSSHTLHRVYKSLKNQTYRNFEWLVVDDGSTDETEILVMSWIKIADFPIRYLKKKNGGKHTAINIGVQNALGELFLIHDADDSCIPETLERFKYHWDSIPPSQKDEYSGITVLCVNSNGEVVGDRFPESPMDISPLNLREYGIAGEKWGFHKTDIFKEFPFPEFPGEKFVAEGLIWNRIAVKYKIRFVNEALRIYEYSPNGLSASILKIRVNRQL